ncbi:MAG: hypothetical protein U0821_25050 [Chloroflexota bacterium]
MTRRKTTLEIDGEKFLIDGKVTYPGRAYRNWPIEGLLMNSRMVNATFDDLNEDTRDRWAYPDTGVWDADRNTDEFLAMLPIYREHGLLAVTLNFQGGSPEAYSRIQPWLNTAFTARGELRPSYLPRISRVLEKLDELGMVCIMGFFYGAQDERLLDEVAVKRAVENGCGWLLDQGYRNVIVEIANECDIPRFEHEIIRPERIHELIDLAKSVTHGGRRLPAGTSYRGRSIPGEKVLEVSDVALIHGNGVTDPLVIGDMVRRTRDLPTYRPMPILFNEDDHFAFDKPVNNMVVALEHYASWGLFDGGKGSGGAGARGDYVEGFQNVPINWTLNTETKQGFFRLLKEVTGA